MVTIYSAYPSIAKVGVGMLTCLQVGTGNKRFVLDVRLLCPLDTSHNSWVSSVSLAVGIVLTVACVLSPFLLGALLIRQAYKKALAAPDPNSMVATLAYRYADYRVDYEALEVGHAGLNVSVRGVRNVVTHVCNLVTLAWDSILDWQRLSLAAVAMAVVLHPLHQLLLVLLVMGSYLLLALIVRPWRSTLVSWLQLGALTVLIASTMALIACNVEADETAALESPYKKALPVVVIVANGLYVVFVVGSLLYCVHKDYWVIQKMLEAGLKVVAAWCCCCCKTGAATCDKCAFQSPSLLFGGPVSGRS